MKVIILNIYLALLCFQTDGQSLPAINNHEQNINNYTVININKSILLQPVDVAFLSTHLVCQPGSCALLPLRLLEFEGKITGAINHLFWETSNENETNYFELQRSSDAVVFNTIGNIGAKNIGGKNRYDYDDVSPLPGKNYYRLKIIDLEEKFIYSKIIILERKTSGKISIYPNPANNILKIKMQSLAACKYELTITDMAGKKIMVENRTSFNGLNDWELHVNQIITGIYQLTIKKEKEEVVTNILLEIIH